MPTGGPHSARIALPVPAPLDAQVAVCLIGFARSFAEPAVCHHVTAAARRLAEAVDIFAVVSSGFGDTPKGQSAAIDPSALARSRAHLAAVDWLDVGSSDENHSDTVKCPLVCTGQFTKFQLCADRLMAHETRRRLRYEWIAKMRPDVLLGPTPMIGGGSPHASWCDVYPRSIATLGLNRSVLYTDDVHGADMFYLVPRALLVTVADGWRRVPCRSHWGQGDCPQLLLDLTALIGSPARRIPLCDCVIARMPESARALDLFGYSRTYSSSAWTFQKRWNSSDEAAVFRKSRAHPWWANATNGRVRVSMDEAKRNSRAPVAGCMPWAT